jgi:hypothetical protein
VELVAARLHGRIDEQPAPGHFGIAADGLDAHAFERVELVVVAGLDDARSSGEHTLERRVGLRRLPVDPELDGIA